MRLARGFSGVAVLVVIVAAIAWLSGWFGEKIEPGNVVVSETGLPEGAATATVEEEAGAEIEWASGTVASARQTIISSRILARIEEVKVSAGDEVAAGDLLVLLDSQDLEARVEQAREARQAGLVRRDLAQTEKNRIEALFQQGVATGQRLDQVTAELRAAEADLQRLEQRLREAETALSYAAIRAPVSGRVVDRLAEPGDIASPGQPLLKIYDPSALRVEAPVRESLAVRLEVGQRLRIEISALSAQFEGPIQEIVPFAEPGARTLLVKVGLPQDPRLYAGLFARIAIPAGVRARLKVPREAIKRIGQLEFATVLESTGRSERRLVTTGETDTEGRIEVLSGLRKGEKVLLPGDAPSTTSGRD